MLLKNGCEKIVNEEKFEEKFLKQHLSTIKRYELKWKLKRPYQLRLIEYYREKKK